MGNLGKRLLNSKTATRLGGYLITSLGARWMMSVDYRVAYYDPSGDVGRVEYNEPVLYLVWHEYLTIPFFVRKRTRLTLLASKHRDAEVLTQAANLFGFKVYRGSSGRGGEQALRDIIRDEDLRGIVITPDGPRGPRRKIAKGAIFLASRLQIPIVLLGAGYDRPIRNTHVWDQHAFPRLYSRARIVMSPKIRLANDMSREKLNAVSESLERSLNRLTNLAEEWAVSGRPMQNESIVYPGPFNCDGRILNVQPPLEVAHKPAS